MNIMDQSKTFFTMEWYFTSETRRSKQVSCITPITLINRFKAIGRQTTFHTDPSHTMVMWSVKNWDRPAYVECPTQNNLKVKFHMNYWKEKTWLIHNLLNAFGNLIYRFIHNHIPNHPFRMQPHKYYHNPCASKIS